jgi:hypothetical protein
VYADLAYQTAEGFEFRWGWSLVKIEKKLQPAQAVIDRWMSKIKLFFQRTSSQFVLGMFSNRKVAEEKDGRWS